MPEKDNTKQLIKDILGNLRRSKLTVTRVMATKFSRNVSIGLGDSDVLSSNR